MYFLIKKTVNKTSSITALITKAPTLEHQQVASLYPHPYATTQQYHDNRLVMQHHPNHVQNGGQS
jgi:hypothetical protein